jgi:hypothetical protein
MKLSPVRGPLPWLVVVGLFVVAVIYIRTVVPDERTAAQSPVVTPGHLSASHGDGLSDSHDGYLLSPVALPDARGEAVPLAFQILGPDRAPVTGYQVVLDEPLHLYLIREDLSIYQHLHPELVADTWTTTVNVPDGGVYRIYVEFTPEGGPGGGHPTVLGVPFIVAGDTRYVPLPAPAAGTTVGGFTVNRLDGTAKLVAGKPGGLRFQVLDASGAPVTALEPYLGVYAHVSAFDVYDQGLTHLHPVNSMAAPADGVLSFHTQFPHRGEQRLFLQFQVAGTVHQTAFTVVVG